MDGDRTSKRRSIIEIDWKFVCSIVSILEYTEKLDSARKLRFLVFGAMVMLDSWYLFSYFDVLAKVSNHLRDDAFLFTILMSSVMYSTESIFQVFLALVLPHPEANERNETLDEDTSGIAIVISCHNSRYVIEKTVRSCLKHVRPDQIFVVDNANCASSPDHTRELLKEIGLHDVNYIYNSYGSKTMALYAGCVAARDCTRVLLMDDDTCLPEDMNFGLDLLTSTVKAVSYPIRAVNPECKEHNSFFTQWQDIEYKMSDFAKMLQDKYCSVLFPHGAVSLWDRKVAIDCLRDHDTVFYAGM